MAIEVALVLVFGAVLIVALGAVGKPIADAVAEKFRYKYRDLGSEAETDLKKKNEYLEAEVMDLKARVKALEEVVDFAAKQQQANGESIKIKEKNV